MKHQKIAEPDYDFQVEELSAQDVLGHSYFTPEVSIMKCTCGDATILINSRNHHFTTGTNFLLVDAVHFKVIECSSDFTMISCRFSILFMNEIYPVLDNKVLDVLQYSAPDLCSKDMMLSCELTLTQLCILDKDKEHSFRHKIVKNLVLIYLHQIYELTYKHTKSRAESTSNYVSYILDSFCALCNENHSKHRKIEYYADRLNISSRYLYKITKSSFGATPKQIIDYTVSGRAKKLLLTTILTNLQISDKLNFPDQATFGQFFKRNVGMSPSEFRNKYR